MSSLDWPSVDANGVSLPTIVSSTDLFDGELFGDELMDIYNSAVVGESSSGAHNEIPHLLSPPTTTSDEKKTESDDTVQIAAAAAAIDDGLGAFRPSTSFSDLTTLLNPSGAPEATPESSTPVATAPSEQNKPTKKRAVSSSSLASQAAPAPKRKATGEKANAPKPAARRVSTSKPATAAVDAKTTAPTSKSFVKYVPANKTDKPTPPDPLSMEAKAPQTVPAVTKKATAPAKQTVKKATAAAAVPTQVPSSTVAKTTSVTPAQSEADFKSIAQVAVSNLIMTASTAKKDGAAAAASKEKVNTSTEHIKALTGNNWVAACANATTGVPPPAPANDAKSNNRARRQNLTPDERARQNRDRNREHARNTRLRKKAYVEELKRTLTELVSQRDAAEFEKRQAAQRELEQREVRFRVIEEFLKLRGRNETNFARWAAILEDGFSLTLPLTDFRKTVQTATKTKFDQLLHGVSDVMADSSMFSEYLQTLGSAEGKGAVTFQYNCVRSNFFMDGCTAVLEWTATSVGAVNKGAASELSLKGTIRGKFSPASNKLLASSMSFDTGSLRVQTPAKKTTGPASSAADIAAAQAADAILDSLQMPRLAVPVPSAVNVVHSSSSTEGSEGKGELDSDDSVSGEKSSNEEVVPMATVSCSAN